MKLLFAASITLLLLAGCGGPNSEKGSTSAAADNAARPSSAAPIDSRTAEWLRSASQAELEFRFADAATIWRKIRDAVIAEQGTGHWQVANCDQAIATAERLATIGPEQRADLERLRALEQAATRNSQSGAYRRALENVQQAQPLAKKAFGDTATIPLRLHFMAGQLAVQLSEWELAKSELELAHNMATDLFAPPHPDLENANYQLGLVERQLGGIDRSVELLLRAQQMTESLVGRDATYAARSRELGVSLHRAGRLDEALAQFTIAEQVAQSLLGPQHTLVAESLLNQAVVLIDLKRWDEAQAKLTSAEAIVQATAPAASLLQDIWRHQATISVVRQDFAAAAQQLERALQSIEEKSGRLNSDYAHVAYRLAMCLSFQRKFEPAEPLFRHALEVQGNVLGRGHDQTRKTLQALATLLQRTERPAEAQSLLKQYSYTGSDSTSETSQ